MKVFVFAPKCLEKASEILKISDEKSISHVNSQTVVLVTLILHRLPLSTPLEDHGYGMGQSCHHLATDPNAMVDPGLWFEKCV